MPDRSEIKWQKLLQPPDLRGKGQKVRFIFLTHPTQQNSMQILLIRVTYYLSSAFQCTHRFYKFCHISYVTIDKIIKNLPLGTGIELSVFYDQDAIQIQKVCKDALQHSNPKCIQNIQTEDNKYYPKLAFLIQ